MKKKSIVLLTFFCLFHLNGKEENLNAPPLSTLSDGEVSHFQMLVEGNNRFGFDLYQHLKNQSGNLYFSPYSIVTGLGMAAIGARGDTQLEFQHAFRYVIPLLLFIGDLNQELQKGDSKNMTAARLSIANELWIDKKIKVLPSFIQVLMKDFRSPLQQVDFHVELTQSIQKINQWVLQRTSGKIQNILSSQDVTANTMMALTTAAQIKGSWASPFDRKETKQVSFYSTPQRALHAEMMQNTGQYSVWRGEKWDILALPYEQGKEGAQLMMAILLPKKDVSLKELEAQLTLDHWKNWKGLLKNDWVTVTLPIFRITHRLDLKNVLKALGFVTTFNEAANFGALTEEKGVFIDTAIHKASIKIDENGSDVSTIGKRVISLAKKEEKEASVFNVDHPFVFIIWDQRTDSILFMGRVNTPY